MHTGIMCHAIPVCIWGSRSIPVCIWGYQRSRMHTGITWHIIPVCIRQSRSIPVCIQGSRRSPFAYGYHMTLIPVCIQGFARCPYAYGDISVTNRMYRGNISIWEIKSCIPSCVISHTGIAVCTWGSQYASGWGSLKVRIWGSRYA